MPRCVQRYRPLSLMIAILTLAVVSLTACQQAESGNVANGATTALATAPVVSTVVAAPTEQAQQSTQAPIGSSASITVLHTNDVDGHVDPCG